MGRTVMKGNMIVIICLSLLNSQILNLMTDGCVAATYFVTTSNMLSNGSFMGTLLQQQELLRNGVPSKLLLVIRIWHCVNEKEQYWKAWSLDFMRKIKKKALASRRIFCKCNCWVWRKIDSLYYSSRKIPERCENSFVDYRINYEQLCYSLR